MPLCDIGLCQKRRPRFLGCHPTFAVPATAAIPTQFPDTVPEGHTDDCLECLGRGAKISANSLISLGPKLRSGSRRGEKRRSATCGSTEAASQRRQRIRTSKIRLSRVLLSTQLKPGGHRNSRPTHSFAGTRARRMAQRTSCKGASGAATV